MSCGNFKYFFFPAATLKTKGSGRHTLGILWTHHSDGDGDMIKTKLNTKVLFIATHNSSLHFFLFNCIELI